ncbi:MAG: glycosyltransferase family 2 protein [Patescibacteria group bacterium]|nr:glycosyltransferase family 2 protein [Patescibacteria group bacterium]
MPKKILSIIVPTFNEAKTIDSVLVRLFSLTIPGYEIEIIVINDGSTDNTKEIITPYFGKIKYFENEKNLGKGKAVYIGVSYVEGELVIIQDADLEYDPDEIYKLVSKLEDDPQLSAVYGSRNLSPTNRGYSHYILGAWFLTKLVNLFLNAKLTDVYTCYKLIRADMLRSLDLQSDGFEIEMEITARLLRAGGQIAEVPISYHPRSFKDGKKIRAMDAIKGLLTFFKILLFSDRY